MVDWTSETSLSNSKNTEHANNLLVGALKQFPMEYIFNVVYRLKESEDARSERDAIQSDVQTKLRRLAERMKGKYLSVKVQATVQDADMIAAAYEELGQDPRVIMKF
ncbi:hypothetical protein CVIRNUC_003204 [Coccomyxa viridis]|uniref:Uncharacterized protein n=1 Tax=Coccomyxa viridis TaxID=1274662 RepID=A0AAV1HXW9_9CHLO|nr:hypothetical protein CVIRNUC_003204 [Coccomyxa viridis]